MCRSSIVYALGRHPDTGKFDPHLAGHLAGNVLFPTATPIEDGSKDVLIPAETVRALGNGDIEAGHKVLDHWHDMVAAHAFNDALNRWLSAPRFR
jgi:hypothetical protein